MAQNQIKLAQEELEEQMSELAHKDAELETLASQLRQAHIRIETLEAMVESNRNVTQDLVQWQQQVKTLQTEVYRLRSELQGMQAVQREQSTSSSPYTLKGLPDNLGVFMTSHENATTQSQQTADEHKSAYRVHSADHDAVSLTRSGSSSIRNDEAHESTRNSASVGKLQGIGNAFASSTAGTARGVSGNDAHNTDALSHLDAVMPTRDAEGDIALQDIDGWVDLSSNRNQNRMDTQRVAPAPRAGHEHAHATPERHRPRNTKQYEILLRGWENVTWTAPSGSGARYFPVNVHAVGKRLSSLSGAKWLGLSKTKMLLVDRDSSHQVASW